jgi:hypothetical protein
MKTTKQKWQRRTERLMAQFSRNSRGVLAAAMELAYHETKRPPGEMFYRTAEFQDAVHDVERMVQALRRHHL